jgi:hypothetical protein
MWACDPVLCGSVRRSGSGEEEDQEWFICVQCGEEGHGETDERDSNFYCNTCWEQYSGVGEPDAAVTESGGTVAGREDEDAATSAADGTTPSTDDSGSSSISPDRHKSMHDPTHPDYWTNLKSEISRRNNDAASSVRRKDVFAHFGIGLTENGGVRDQSADVTPESDVGDALSLAIFQRQAGCGIAVILFCFFVLFCLLLVVYELHRPFGACGGSLAYHTFPCCVVWLSVALLRDQTQCCLKTVAVD